MRTEQWGWCFKQSKCKKYTYIRR